MKMQTDYISFEILYQGIVTTISMCTSSLSKKWVIYFESSLSQFVMLPDMSIAFPGASLGVTKPPRSLQIYCPNIQVNLETNALVYSTLCSYGQHSLVKLKSTVLVWLTPRFNQTGILVR